MNFEIKSAASQKIVVIFGVLLILSLVNIVSLVVRAKHTRALTAKVNQQAMIIKEKDKQLEADKVQYTSLAARLHKEVKKAGALEEELKKYKRGK
ncbi:MAG: hypothetical protein KJ710_04410 [Candidatus Omnitrophica bacterium]|nr:hypothetical protein [Candidatus Omnitrophota bacterium]MBU1923482.1 hypothetical protein [Candidatus Omnitrophota bacterium]